MKQIIFHFEQLTSLKKIEGQIRGIQRMIEEKRYCLDIITQIHSSIGALYRIKTEIFKKHLNGCVIKTLKGKSRMEKEKKINELIELVAKFSKV